MAAGRPTKFKAEYCERAIDFLRDGYSVAALAGEIGVTISTIYEWANKHPEFSDAVKVGQAGAVLWWEKANRKMATTGEGNATSIIFGLKNRAPGEWREKQEIEHSGITVEITRLSE